MKAYLTKRIEGLALGVTGLQKALSEGEQLLAQKRNQLIATQSALEEAKEALTEFNKLAAPTPAAAEDGPKET